MHRGRVKKKLVVAGAITCVTAIVTASAAGCGTTEATRPAPDASEDVRSERTRSDASEGDDAGACPLDVPLTKDDLLAEPGYKPGKVSAGACTPEELAQFEKNLDDVDVKTWIDLGRDIGQTCADCIVTSSSAPSWGPVVYTEESGGDRGFYNFGACFGVVEGSDLCGQSVQFLELCFETACSCAHTRAERERCLDAAGDLGSMCEEFVAALQKDCKQIAASDMKCNDVVKAAKTLCGPAAADGGADGGADASDSGDANDQ